MSNHYEYNDEIYEFKDGYDKAIIAYKDKKKAQALVDKKHLAILKNGFNPFYYNYDDVFQTWGDETFAKHRIPSYLRDDDDYTYNIPVPEDYTPAEATALLKELDITFFVIEELEVAD